MSDTERLSRLKEGTLRTDTTLGFPQTSQVSIDGIMYEFRFNWNPATSSMILTVYHTDAIYLKTKLIIGEKIILYAPKNHFKLFGQKTIATITPIIVTSDFCELKVIWLKRYK